MLKFIVAIVLLLSGMELMAQDSVPPPRDTVERRLVQRPRVPRAIAIATDSIGRFNRSFGLSDSFFARTAQARPDTMMSRTHPFYRLTGPVRYGVSVRQWEGKEAVFYSMIALLLFFALIRNGFYRYLQDLFRAYFQTSAKQRQIKEQLLQNPLPSLLLNIFFLLSIGMFLALLLQYFQLALDMNFWVLYMYCTIGLLVIYGGKFLSLKLLGWIFQVSEAIDSYIFIVFTTNKIIGIALLPMLVVLAFSYGFISRTAMTISIMVIGGLLVYRFFLSYTTIRRQIRIHFFHFLLYLLAFEVAPLLLINKLLFRFLEETP